MPPRRRDEQGRPRRIAGPQSALTDFLASRNISAYDIEQNYRARQEAAAQQLTAERQQQQQEEAQDPDTATQAGAATTGQNDTVNGESSPSADTSALYGAEVTGGSRSRNGDSRAGGRQLSATQKRAVDKIKADKKNKSKKRPTFDSDEDDEQDELARSLLRDFKGSSPLPGQLENCAQCDKRFTVTPYSRADATGRLLCGPCGRLLDKDKDEAARQKQQAKKKARMSAAGPVGQRRKAQSGLLDGVVPTGPKSLATLCVEHLSKNIHLADDLGDLSDPVIDRIARILSKRRLVTPETVALFIRPEADNIAVYDCACLTEADFVHILQTMPRLKHVRLHNAIQFKDAVMAYLMQRDVALESLCLYGANLLSDTQWKAYLAAKGAHLRTLHICETDKYVTDEVAACITDSAPQLRRLKIRVNQKMTSAGLAHVGRLTALQHLNLHIDSSVHADVYVRLIVRLGTGLQTLSLRGADGVDNSVLAALHEHGRVLRKLRIQDSQYCTDEGFVRLFEGWENPPLHVVDLEKNRYDEPDQPSISANVDGIGFCSKAFEALMAHSGSELRTLNLHACRHIGRDAFEAVFAEGKQYPALRYIDVSFCGEVTDHIVCSMFRCCPELREVASFGCMLVTGSQVPSGRILVGVPNALGMQTVGSGD